VLFQPPQEPVMTLHRFACPDCDKRLKIVVPPKNERPIQCPHCSAVFLLPEGSAAPRSRGGLGFIIVLFVLALLAGSGSALYFFWDRLFPDNSRTESHPPPTSKPAAEPIPLPRSADGPP
jgi:hypothetical protein